MSDFSGKQGAAREAAQFARFGAVGLFLTLSSVATYYALAQFLGWDPNFSLFVSYLVFTAVGFFIHRRVSFRLGGGEGKTGKSMARYLLVTIVGFLLNEGFISLFVKILHAPLWSPIIPMILVTPLVVYLLNRNWVFGAEGGSATAR